MIAVTAVTASSLVVAGLLGCAVAICVLYSFGLMVMRDAFQRLHYATPIVAIAAPLVAVAVWIADDQAQARIKSALIAATLLATAAVLNHANARAFRLRKLGYFDPRPVEQIPVVGADGFAGQDEKLKSKS